MSAYNFRFTDNTAKMVRFKKEMSPKEVKTFLSDEKEQFFDISLNERIVTSVRKDTVIEFTETKDKDISPSDKQWKIL